MKRRRVRVCRPKPQQDMRLLVVAAPRSGTRFTAHALRRVGINALHERLGRHGTVSSFFAVDDYYYMPSGHLDKERRSGFRWGQVWHQIRNPLHTIGSLHHGRIKMQWWIWQERHTGVAYQNHPDAAARFWLRWQEIIEADPEVCWRYRVEDIVSIWPEMLDRLGIEPQPFPDNLNSEHGKSPDSRPVTLDELSPEIVEAVAKKATEYGYII